MCLDELQQLFNILKESFISIDNLFTIPSTPYKEKIIRKYASPIINALPVKGRYIFTGIVKKIRNPKSKLTLNYPMTYIENQIIAKTLKIHNLRPWWNKKAVICLSHDIDNVEGYRYTKTMAEIDAKYNIQSTFNFITHDYKIDKPFIHSIAHAGFEVGLHGYNHDQGFAFRNPKKIKTEIKMAIDALDTEEVVGYRSPALSISETLFQVLSEMNFLFDSTMQIASPFYYSVKLPYPYYFKKYDMWEIPLMVQDDNYFRDSSNSENDILGSIQHFIKDIISLNGVMTINMHPHIMTDNRKFYENFIKLIKQFSNDVAYSSTRSVIKYAKTNINNS